VTLDLKSRWKQFGKLGQTFSVLVVVYLLMLWLAPASGFTTFLQVVGILLALWILLRLARVALRKAIWRLRNRLYVTYVLIAVVPILLILTLAALGGYMLASQVAVYLARSELDRRVDAMRAATDALMLIEPKSRPEVLRRTGELYRERDPGIVLLIDDGGTVLRWPEDTNIERPPKTQDNISGIFSRERRYYAGSLATRNGVEFLAMTPLTRRYLSGLVPGLGDVYFLLHSAEAAETAPKQAAGLHVGRAPKQAPVTFGEDQFEFLPAGREAAPTALPPPVNQFDLGVRWFSLFHAVDWMNPSRTNEAVLMVHTRFSALLQVLLSQKSDEFQGLLPIALLAVAIAFFIVEIVSLIIGVSLTRTITGAVHSLYEGTQRVMKSDFSHKIPVSGRDQLADLSRSFNTMTENLERLLAVAKEKERLQAEIEIAREVQEQLYPKTAPTLKTLRVTGMCQPARMVSGDYFDYQALPDNKLAVAIGDVAGKGISAALLMATIQSAMRMELRTSLEPTAQASVAVNGFRLSTARLVSDLNKQLYATTSPEKFATFCLALYDDETGLMTYTNAGHPPPILIRDGEATRFDVNGTVVGAFPLSPYDESQIQLRSGDLLICYTDGITEPENEYGEMFGEERLVELIAKNAERQDSHIIETLMDSVRHWTTSSELSDDMTVVLARKS
jgi:phosphoserine phosphatase RsbU/P